jgi:hypothetical protein
VGSTSPVNVVDSAVIVSSSATDLKITFEDLTEYTCLTDAYTKPAINTRANKIILDFNWVAFGKQIIIIISAYEVR